ncbi:MAG: methionyl-tRNA formyltransferase [Desulfobacterales bacterium]|nr:methionyl-tRNA formyltransferase [Desulfobacterales bacterium]
MNSPLKIIFMGTPEFAVPTLQALHRGGHALPLVITQPDRPKGRGRKTTPPPVKTAANRLGLVVEQPVSIRAADVVEKLKKLEPDFFVVVAMGQILSPDLLDIPRMGAINVHASLLPKYRGAAPIQWALINGEKETGITTMRMDAGLDTGDMLLAAQTQVAADDTAQTLHDRLCRMGADLLIETINGLISNTITPVPQDHELASKAPLLKKNDGHIDWHKPAGAIVSFIRGMTPWPGAFSFMGDRRFKIFAARPVPLTSPAPPGTVIKGFSNELRVATGDQALSILELQAASGKRLPVRDYLIGNPITEGTVLN